MQKRSCLLLIIILFLLATPPAMFAASVQLSWQPNAEPDLQEYNVYYGTQSRSYGLPIPVDKSATYTLSGLDEGMVYYFAVSAVDNNGNESGFSEEISKTIASIDTQPPTVTITSPTSAQTLTTENNQISIAGTAIDDSRIDQIIWTTSTGASGTASGTTAWSVSAIALQEGANTITVTAVDAAGNSSQDTLTVTYSAIDFKLMVSTTSDLTNALPLTDQTVSGNIRVFLTPEAEVAQVVFALDGKETRIERQAPFELGFSDTTALNNGSHTASGQITLQDGSSHSVSATFTVQNEQTPPPDVTAPSVSILSPTTSGTYQTDQATLPISGSAQDDNEVNEIRWTTSTGASGTASGTTAWSVSAIALQEGTNTITVTATDSNDNQDTATLTVVYTAPDTKAPEIAITSPMSGDFYTTDSATISLAGTASDDRELHEISWSTSTGDSGMASGTENWLISGINLAFDETMITVTAKDSAGNTASDTLTVNYAAADTTAPSLQITLPTTKSSYFSRTSTVNIGGTAGDNDAIAKVVWENSRGESGVCNGTNQWQATGITLDRWWNTITVTAFDNAGNSDVKELKVFRWK